ncbi:iron-sulfur cluster assembly accessory protein [Trichophyton tonsurans CBS 112818]|uniref:Iron-sulfur cluster assembly accessory protein n=1 Tax=Trichophyton tonsurans (strain CBS 112818) TaxID=647933 RepID=F2RPI3_TRIT1|nr:iron-sulfur cluster assembly accessory protein [Trichophyton tonsurans CBS 112818]
MPFSLLSVDFRLHNINAVTPSPNDDTIFHLRIRVTSGGCHGFQYIMSLEQRPDIKLDEDTVFEFTGFQAKVVTDFASLQVLAGSTIDYITELIGSQFRIVDNPRAISSCGCGTSFDLKE